MSTSRSRIDLSTVKNDEMKKITIQITQSEFDILQEACQITGHRPAELLAALFRTEIKPRLNRTLSDLRNEHEQKLADAALLETLTAPIREPLRAMPQPPIAALNTPTPLNSRAPTTSSLSNASSPGPTAQTGQLGTARPSVLPSNPTQTQSAPLNSAPAAPAQPPSSAKPMSGTSE